MKTSIPCILEGLSTLWRLLDWSQGPTCPRRIGRLLSYKLCYGWATYSIKRLLKSFKQVSSPLHSGSPILCKTSSSLLPSLCRPYKLTLCLPYTTQLPNHSNHVLLILPHFHSFLFIFPHQQRWQHPLRRHFSTSRQFYQQ